MPIFPEILDRISSIERVLGNPGGSLLLAGRPGMARKSTVEFVCQMLDIKSVSLNVTRNYSVKNFYTDVKNVLQVVGLAGEEMALIIEDYQFVNERILEAINSLLSGGEIPGLYAPDELDSILGNLKGLHSEKGLRCTLFEYFTARIQSNLHIVVIMDSADPNFSKHCESNPALFTRCHIDWTSAWSSESMKAIALSALNDDDSLRELKNLSQIADHLIGLHNYMAKTFAAAPKHLMVYLKTYMKIFATLQSAKKNKMNYLIGGLTKLTEASNFVDKLSADAKNQGIELEEKQILADSALKQITESMMKASDQKKEMELLNSQLLEEEEKTVSRKMAIEVELQDVEPIVKAAQSAVGEIRPESLSEIRSLRAPPAAVRDVLEGVLRLMGILDMSWTTMKGFLGKRTIKDEILNFGTSFFITNRRQKHYKVNQRICAAIGEPEIRKF